MNGSTLLSGERDLRCGCGGDGGFRARHWCFADWLRFALSYTSVVALEPLLTVAVLLGVARVRRQRWAALCFDARAAFAAR